ncbi:unnamed protein product [Amoebophrya sp. A25]|nr:unnamed protein product [Amoebophrya sp. A25]|eukprot:GSA25T00020969001.1
MSPAQALARQPLNRIVGKNTSRGLRIGSSDPVGPAGLASGIIEEHDGGDEEHAGGDRDDIRGVSSTLGEQETLVHEDTCDSIFILETQEADVSTSQPIRHSVAKNCVNASVAGSAAARGEQPQQGARGMSLDEHVRVNTDVDQDQTQNVQKTVASEDPPPQLLQKPPEAHAPEAHAPEAHAPAALRESVLRQSATTLTSAVQQPSTEQEQPVIKGDVALVSRPHRKTISSVYGGHSINPSSRKGRYDSDSEAGSCRKNFEPDLVGEVLDFDDEGRDVDGRTKVGVDGRNVDGRTERRAAMKGKENEDGVAVAGGGEARKGAENHDHRTGSSTCLVDEDQDPATTKMAEVGKEGNNAGSLRDSSTPLETLLVQGARGPGAPIKIPKLIVPGGPTATASSSSSFASAVEAGRGPLQAETGQPLHQHPVPDQQPLLARPQAVNLPQDHGPEREQHEHVQRLVSDNVSALLSKEPVRALFQSEAESSHVKTNSRLPSRNIASSPPDELTAGTARRLVLPTPKGERAAGDLLDVTVTIPEDVEMEDADGQVAMTSWNVGGVQRMSIDGYASSPPPRANNVHQGRSSGPIFGSSSSMAFPSSTSTGVGGAGGQQSFGISAVRTTGATSTTALLGAAVPTSGFTGINIGPTASSSRPPGVSQHPGRHSNSFPNTISGPPQMNTMSTAPTTSTSSSIRPPPQPQTSSTSSRGPLLNAAQDLRSTLLADVAEQSASSGVEARAGLEEDEAISSLFEQRMHVRRKQ